MRDHGLLLYRQGRLITARRFDREIVKAASNTRSCANGFETARDNRERRCVASALDCCDREVMDKVRTAKKSNAGMIRALRMQAV